MQNSSTYFGIKNISNFRGLRRGSRYSDEATNMKDGPINYLNCEEGAIPWETENIRRTFY